MDRAEESDIALWLPLIRDLTYREIHAFFDGFYCGIHGITETDYTQEQHYWRVAWVIGDWYDRWKRK